MSRLPLKFVWVGAIAPTLLAACSGNVDQSAAALEERHAPEFSSQDKIAARVLSIGSAETVKAAGSPYNQALSCRNSLQATVALLRGRALAGEQMQALESSATFYDHQLASLGRKEGKTDADIRRDLARVGAENALDSTEVRLALGCLRSMVQPG